MTDWVHLRELEIRCIVGVEEAERETPQPLVLEVSVGLDLEGAAGGDLGATVDYQALEREVRFLVEEGRWRLVESVAAVVLRHVLRPKWERAAGGPDGGQRPPGAGPAIERARVRVTKPEALGGAAIPTVEMEREAGWFRPEAQTPAPGVELTVLLQTPESTAYAVDLAPEATWSPPQGTTVLVTEGTLHAGDRTHETGHRLHPRPQITAGPAPTRLLAVTRTATQSQSMPHAPLGER
ncbi:MAG TPA: dihydroneopterin aldolase [Thermoanaerobaculia bacterium]|nr:dihydroneopterin aldolase [Thermoanaerobaculia bacterium]